MAITNKFKIFADTANCTTWEDSDIAEHVGFIAGEVAIANNINTALRNASLLQYTLSEIITDIDTSSTYTMGPNETFNNTLKNNIKNSFEKWIETVNVNTAKNWDNAITLTLTDPNENNIASWSFDGSSNVSTTLSSTLSGFDSISATNFIGNASTSNKVNHRFRIKCNWSSSGPGISNIVDFNGSSDKELSIFAPITNGGDGYILTSKESRNNVAPIPEFKNPDDITVGTSKKLGTSSIGNVITPIYLNDGSPMPITIEAASTPSYSMTDNNEIGYVLAFSDGNTQDYVTPIIIAEGEYQNPGAGSKTPTNWGGSEYKYNCSIIKYGNVCTVGLTVCVTDLTKTLIGYNSPNSPYWSLAINCKTLYDIFINHGVSNKSIEVLSINSINPISKINNSSMSTISIASVYVPMQMHYSGNQADFINDAKYAIINFRLAGGQGFTANITFKVE